MIKIADSVRGMVYESEIALTALANGYLNLSAYAKSIQQDVEQTAKKPVKIGSIVAALSRLAHTLQQQPPLLPYVHIENLSVKSGLVEITLNKTTENRNLMQSLNRDPLFASADFFTVTQGMHEISLVVPRELSGRVRACFRGQKPKLILDHLAALTVRFGEEYIRVPNVTYALVRHFAIRRINIVEIVSTFTELTFILAEDDLDTSFSMMHQLTRATGDETRF